MPIHYGERGGIIPWFGKVILSIIDWLKYPPERKQPMTLNVMRMPGVTGGPYSIDAGVWCKGVLYIGDDGEPVLSDHSIWVKRHDRHGNELPIGECFKIVNISGRSGRFNVRYEWRLLEDTAKPKRKQSTEQMATLGELFEGYEGDDIKLEEGKVTE